MNESWQKPLDELLADLPRDIPPPRYLWRGIRVRLDHSPRRARPLVFAAAACVLGACVASVLTWAVMHGRPASAPIQVAVRAPIYDEPRNPSYVTARADLEVNFRQQLALLDPATRARIEASLAVIRRAPASAASSSGARPTPCRPRR